MKIVITSGYFDCLHSGHLEYLYEALNLGDKHYCIVNNDKQCILKKGFAFLDEKTRLDIVGSLNPVDNVQLSIDEDLSVSKTLELLFDTILDCPLTHPNPSLLFFNSGDVKDIREKEVCEKYGCEIRTDSSEKVNSSSKILKRYQDYIAESMKKVGFWAYNGHR